MKTLQDYISTFSSVASKLGYTGESIDILVQLLANASYISEIENINYSREASLDKAMLMNSKIQHCMDDMYSVYRGHCPRIVLSVNFTRPVAFKPYDEIIRSSKFSIYYIGIYEKREKEDGSFEFEYIEGNSIELSEDSGRKFIVGFIAPSATTVNTDLTKERSYYVECFSGNLSNDVFVKFSETGESPKVTRNFADHILYPQENLFDLTTTDYGSRIYTADYFQGSDVANNSGAKFSVTFYEYSVLDDYNFSEFERLVLKGSEPVPYDDSDLPLTLGKTGVLDRGILLIEATTRDSLPTIHYKANKCRFMNSILRSNSDVGYLLEESFPQSIRSGGTYYTFEIHGDENFLNIYYIPTGNKLTEEQLTKFRTEKCAYYVAGNSNINIIPGEKWQAKFNISVELFRNLDEDYSKLIGQPIISEYSNKFNVNFSEQTMGEIISKIGKLENVKRIESLRVEYQDSFGNTITDLAEVEVPDSVYYEITVSLTTTTRS